MDGCQTFSLLRRDLAVAAFCLAVAGCTADGAGAGANLEDSVQPQQAKMLALAANMHTVNDRPPIAAVPTQLATVVSVRTRDYADGLRQDVALSGSAVRGIANGMTVLVRTSRQQTLEERVPLEKPSEGVIRSEIGAQFPHVPMQVVERQSSNSYGPYGLALGRAPNGIRCLYMWQWIDANRLPQAANLVGPASVRARICRAGVTFDEMAAALDHLEIGRAPALAPDDRLASNDQAQVIVMSDASAMAPGVQAPSADEVPKARVRRHSLARHRRAAKAEMVAADPGIAVSPYGTGAPSSPASDRPAPTMSAPTLPADLPPQAYLGPKATSQAHSPN